MYMKILAIFYPPLKQIWGCVWLCLQAQEGNTYFTELAERVEYGNHVGPVRVPEPRIRMRAADLLQIIYICMYIYIYIYIYMYLLKPTPNAKPAPKSRVHGPPKQRRQKHWLCWLRTGNSGVGFVFGVGFSRFIYIYIYMFHTMLYIQISPNVSCSRSHIAQAVTIRHHRS